MRAVRRPSNRSHWMNTGIRARKVKASAPTHRIPAPAWVLGNEYIEATGRVEVSRASARNDSIGTPISRATIFAPWPIGQWGM